MPVQLNDIVCERGSRQDSVAIRLKGGHAEKSRTVAAYREGQHVDVEVHSADGIPFRVHGLVLMAASDYFYAMYNGGWRDTSGPLMLCAVPTDALEACLEWIYTGVCEAANDQALRAILEAAVYLQICPLVDEACRVMRFRLCPRTALATWCVADSCGQVELAEMANMVSCRDFSIAAVGEEWLSMPSTYVHALLSDKRLCAESEEEVYHAVIAWLRASEPAANAETAGALLSLVHYELISPAFASDAIMKEPLLLTQPGTKMVSGVMPGENEISISQASTRRHSSSRLYAIGPSFQCYDPSANAWEDLEVLDMDYEGEATKHLYLDDVRGAEIDGRFYVAGSPMGGLGGGLSRSTL